MRTDVQEVDVDVDLLDGALAGLVVVDDMSYAAGPIFDLNERDGSDWNLIKVDCEKQLRRSPSVSLLVALLCP